MNINNLLNPVDKFFININENKSILLILLVLLGIYLTQYIEPTTENLINLFSNNIFKFVIFIIITYITGSSPALGIGLAIVMLVTLQIITNLKFKKEIKNEKFSQIDPIDPVDMTYLNDEYLTNPLLMVKDLSPPIGLNLKLENPNQLYSQMLKKGKLLLNDSYELEKDLDKRFDVREQKIAEITRRNGMDLVDSGINRLQKSDQGEYNIINSNPKFSKFIIYNKLLEGNTSNPAIMAIYTELKNNYDILLSRQLDKNSFDNQLEKIYQNELEFLETIYKYKKDKISPEQQKQIENEINKTKQLKYENKDLWINKLKEICNLLG